MPRQRRSPAKERREARSERRRDATRNEIVDAAREVVLRDGVANFTLVAVSDLLGLTKPALYYYFANKEALLFELLLSEWLVAAQQTQAAVEQTRSGADAIEALMRATFSRYRTRLDLFRVSFNMAPGGQLADLIGPAELERLRPTNEMLYGGTESRLRADQDRGIFPKDRDPRRFAFTAHASIVGLLNMKALVDSANDPLVHRDDDLIDDLCRSFRSIAQNGDSHDAR